METEVTLFELFVSCTGVGIAILSAWVHMRINVSQLNTELKYIKKEVNDEKNVNKENFNQLNAKIDELFSLMSEIKVTIAKK